MSLVWIVENSLQFITVVQKNQNRIKKINILKILTIWKISFASLIWNKLSCQKKKKNSLIKIYSFRYYKEKKNIWNVKINKPYKMAKNSASSYIKINEISLIVSGSVQIIQANNNFLELFHFVLRLNIRMILEFFFLSISGRRLNFFYRCIDVVDTQLNMGALFFIYV